MIVSSVGEDTRQQEDFHNAGGNVTVTSNLENSLTVSYKNEDTHTLWPAILLLVIHLK